MRVLVTPQLNNYITQKSLSVGRMALDWVTGGLTSSTAKRSGQGLFSLEYKIRGRQKREGPILVIYDSCSTVRNVKTEINEF